MAPPGASWHSGAGYSRSPPAFPVWRIQPNGRRDAVLPGVFPELQPLRTHTLPSRIFSLGTQVAGISLNPGPSASWVSQRASFSAPTAQFTSLEQCKVRQRNCCFCWLSIEPGVFIFIREGINAHILVDFQTSKVRCVCVCVCSYILYIIVHPKYM